MKLKLMTFSAISALLLSSSAFAQNPEGRGIRGGNRQGVLETTTERLNLTAEQKAKVQPIIDQTNPQIRAIQRDAMQKIRALVDNALAQIRPVLTSEQQQLLDESQQQRRGGRRGGMKGPESQQQQSDDEGDQ